ncbi:MAG TPA: sulfotransferase [Burkholderiaceae bacterium]|nr:sulfotransferase [Burkholderiaceae bacterium]
MPIFIVGFARSGTTLCQKLVAQHLGVPTLPETHYFEFLEDHEPAGGFIRPEAARALLGQLEPFLKIDVAALKPLLSRDEVPIRPLFLHLVGQQIGSQPLADKGQWVEKTPGHAEHLERIYQMFPKARFLCMVRNPVHAFASRRELQSTGRGWGEAWKPIEAFCASWTEHVRNFQAFAERHPGQLMTIRLEDLAAQPQVELARVREFLGPGFANPIDAPLQHDIIQPFETWKRDALKPADASIAEREGKGLLDDYETWRVKTLLRESMAAFDYPVDAREPAGMDELHRRMVASLDWYVDTFARRDSLMDVKTTRIRNLLNELAERNASTAGPAPPRPVVIGTIAGNPLLVARVGALARNDAQGSDDEPPAPPTPLGSTPPKPLDAGPAGSRASAAPGKPVSRSPGSGVKPGPGASEGSAKPGARQQEATFRPGGKPAGLAPQGASAAGVANASRPAGETPGAGATTRPGGAIGAPGGSAMVASGSGGPAAGGGPRAGGGGLGLGANRPGKLGGGGGQAGKPGQRAGLKAGGPGRPGARPGGGKQTHVQRQGKNLVVDNEGELDDNLPAAWRPLTLHGISGVNDNGDTFLGEAEQIVAQRKAQPPGKAGAEAGEDITDADDA